MEHYYHFLLGFLMPLADALATRWGGRDFRNVLVRSCGPLDHIVDEFADSRIKILSKEAHARLASGGMTEGEAPSFDTIRGFHHPSAYSFHFFRSVSERFLARADVAAECAALPPQWSGAATKILLIQRAPPHPFYASPLSEASGAGASRRSIANYEALRDAIAGRFGGCFGVATEGMPLARQIALFARADIILAQHGAALSNIVWAKRDASVIEYFPRKLDYMAGVEPKYRFTYFSRLAQCLGLRHRKIEQDAAHSDVDIEETCSAIADCFIKPSHTSALVQRARYRAYQYRSRAHLTAGEARRLFAWLRASSGPSATARPDTQR